MCLNGGTCSNQTVSTSLNCICPSNYYGQLCEYQKCSATNSQCLNGACLTHTETKKSICFCKPSHTGALCERPLCLDYCYNNGYCNDGFGTEYDFEKFLEKSYSSNLTCSCSSERFTGDRCQFDKCYGKVDKCPSNCTLSSNCECLCGTECDKSFCNAAGTCVSVNNKLACQ